MHNMLYTIAMSSDYEDYAQNTIHIHTELYRFFEHITFKVILTAKLIQHIRGQYGTYRRNQ